MQCINPSTLSHNASHCLTHKLSNCYDQLTSVQSNVYISLSFTLFSINVNEVTIWMQAVLLNVTQGQVKSADPDPIQYIQQSSSVVTLIPKPSWSIQALSDNVSDTQTYKPVGFYGPIAPQFRMPPVRNAPELRSQHDAVPPVQLQYPGERRAAAAMPLPESPWRKRQNVSPPSVLFESSRNFFTIHRRHGRKK